MFVALENLFSKHTKKETSWTLTNWIESIESIIGQSSLKFCYRKEIYNFRAELMILKVLFVFWKSIPFFWVRSLWKGNECLFTFCLFRKLFRFLGFLSFVRTDWTQTCTHTRFFTELICQIEVGESKSDHSFRCDFFSGSGSGQQSLHQMENGKCRRPEKKGIRNVPLFAWTGTWSLC